MSILNPMRRLTSLFLCLLLTSALAQKQIETENFIVIFEEHLTKFAEQSAFEAETALAILEPIFGSPSDKIAIVIEDDFDAYNAFASLLPHPNIHLRALFPTESSVGFGSESDLYLLILHELTHVTQLAYTGSEGGFSFGIVGENQAYRAPPWFIEGIAVYMESAYTQGGRVEDARTTGLLHTRAFEDSLPELVEVSLDTFSDWPSGAARYLYGGYFVTYLVDKYGFEAIIGLLKDYNSGLPKAFSVAWQNANGSSLFDDWDAWKASIKNTVEQRDWQDESLLTQTSGSTGSPAFNAVSNQLAWYSAGKIQVAELIDGELQNQKTILEGTVPNSLSWLNNRSLIYNRSYRQPNNSYYELFRLDIETGIEEKLSQNARAKLVATHNNCIYYVQDQASIGSTVLEWCDGEEQVIIQLENNEHIVGLDISLEGQLALSIWRTGFVDIAYLNQGTLEYLTTDGFQDLDPIWFDEETIVFSSDRTGVFNLFELNITQAKLTQLSNVLGGAFEAVIVNNTIVYSAMGPTGYNLALLDPLEISTELKLELLPTATIYPDFEVTAYNPLASLAPYGWYPSYFDYDLSPLSAGVGISVVGQDHSNTHSYAFNLAYDTALTGKLAGTIANIQYGFQDNADPARIVQHPFGVQFQLGLWKHFPHLQNATETALGFRTQLRLTQTFDKWSFYSLTRLGIVQLNSQADWHLEGLTSIIFSKRGTDSWDYVTKGSRLTLTGLWTPSPSGPSAGAWLNLSHYEPLRSFGLNFPGTSEFTVRAGYRQAAPIPLSLEPYSAVGTLGYRYSQPINYRLYDGYLALERISFEPRLRAWYDGEFFVGSDLGINADILLLYELPLSAGFTVGYGEAFWYRFGLRLNPD